MQLTRDKQIKAIKIVCGLILVITVVLLSVRYIANRTYLDQLPEIPDQNSLSGPLSEQFSQADKKARRSPTAVNLGMLGMAYQSGAYYEQAITCYQLASKRNNSAWEWHYYLGFLNREMGKPGVAIENFRAVIRENAEAYHAWYYLGEAYQKTGDYKKAEMAFLKIAEIHNSQVKTSTRTDYFQLDTYAKFQLARIYLDTERTEHAEKTLQEILVNNRAFGQAYRLLGTVYNLKGDSISGNRYIVRANDLAVYSQPVDTLVDKLSLMSRSELYVLKKIDEAENGVYPEWALRLINNATQYIPDNSYLLSKTIKLYLITGNGKQAVPYLDRHFNHFLQDPVELRSVAELLFTKGFYGQSLTYYTQVQKIKPDDVSVQAGIVLCLWKGGQQQKALSMTTEMLGKNKSNTSYLSEGVNLLFSLGQYEKAAPWLIRLKERIPSDPKVQKLLGMQAEHDGNLPVAALYYESSFDGNPKDITTIRYLIIALVKQGKWEKSINYLKKALEHHPNDPYLLERLGTLLVSCPELSLRNIPEGKQFSERAFIHTASHSSTLISSGRSLAVAYEALGDRQNAYKIMNMTVNLARRNGVPADLQAELEKLLKSYSH